MDAADILIADFPEYSTVSYSECHNPGNQRNLVVQRLAYSNEADLVSG
ncbi:Uncharacterised protein [Bordetella parapertussis]|uniref:Uncharacterized protein n=1 Tax=Bordetella bronchiseptica 00-P-2796 TaxID=1331199 RepID=A0ABR4RG57_BORBO|nr:hypothetical protein L507_0101 [Bordetella bronchiseptica CA90 BB02]KCV35318.1 hypothetical protein L490_4981 [Bordetella bronchiseptica 00-P-2796]KCV40578.1 hypothetical protein L572_0188 [Bordetella bronchiseptica 345]KDB59512.1 hypothetical protein AZ15_0126 [Bordetella bronchiseptica A1-7]KDB61657.1 hypothetical protein AZ16_0125 [Bordetella bronchiseptica B18-5 (C3)]KDB72744.1 hypothetical protein AZ21_0232 [Bordetella bronchiseptica B20-10725633]KDB81768.1 hypothetical protein L495_0